MGATKDDLYRLKCLFRRNPYYRSGSQMKLYVYDEVHVLASANNETKRLAKEKYDELKRKSDTRRDASKKARLDSYTKRMESLRERNIIPTPGLVSGDFCMTITKNTKVGIRSLLKRRALWNRCSHAETPVAVQVFNWATRNKKTDIDFEDAVDAIAWEKSLFDKVSVVEGNTILSFLDETDRLVLINTNGIFSETLHSLGTHKVDPELSSLCERIGNILDVPFRKVLEKLESSKHTWISRYLYIMRPDRVASILRPHLMGVSKKKEILQRDMNESFARWGLKPSDAYRKYVPYFEGDIVDVELFSASCFMGKSALVGQEDIYNGLRIITFRVMNTPGAKWMETTKEYMKDIVFKSRERGRERMEKLMMTHEDTRRVFKMKEQEREHKERLKMMDEDTRRALWLTRTRVCPCGNIAALMCPFSKCSKCCVGPCTRHHKLILS